MRSEVLIPILILSGSALVSIVALMITSSSKKRKKTDTLTINTAPLPVQGNDTGFNVVPINTQPEEEKQEIVEETKPEFVEPKVIKIDTSNTVVPIKTTPTVVPLNTTVEPTVVDTTPLPNNTVVDSTPLPRVEETVVDTTPLPSINNTVVDTTPLPAVEQTVVDSTPLPSVQQTVVDNTPLPLVDVPIPTIDDTPIDVEETKVLTNETDESVSIDTPTPIKEESIPTGEEVKIEEAKPLTNETETSVDVEHSTPLANDQGENVNLTFAQPMNDIKSAAFASIPTNNTTINTDVKVESHEYEGNKTEIFNLDDIKEALNEE